MRPFRSLALSCAVAVSALTACGSGGATERAADPATAVSPSTTSPAATAGSPTTATNASDADTSNVAGDHDDASDYTWNQSDEIAITLKGTSASSSSNSVKISGSTVTIAAAGTYRITGSLTNGQIVVDTDDDAVVRLVLNGVDITNSSRSAITIDDAQKVVIMLADGTQNRVADAATYTFPDATTDEPNAAIFSTADLTIAGSGTLTVDGNFNDAIASKDGLIIAGGTITVDAVDDGIRGKDYVVVKDGTITVRAGGDALKADNAEDDTAGRISISGGTFDLTSGGDAIQAATSVTITDGRFDLESGGGSSATIAADASGKGIKGTTNVTINGGTITISAADDAVHSNNSVIIGGGTFAITTGDDGVHADATLAVNGGTIDITKSYEGLESAAITIAGGDISVTASDDGVNGAGGVDGSGAQAQGGGRDNFAAGGTHSLTVTGGRLAVTASGDGVDVNGSITMSGGTVIVHGPTANNNGALDYDGTFVLTGGVVIAAGSAGMAQAPGSGSTQATVAVRLSAAQPAGTLVRIQSANGDTIVAFTPTKSFQSVVVSTPAVVNGTTYDVIVGGTASGTKNDGVYEGGAASGGTKVASATATTTSTSTSGMAGPGAR